MRHVLLAAAITTVFPNMALAKDGNPNGLHSLTRAGPFFSGVKETMTHREYKAFLHEIISAHPPGWRWAKNHDPAVSRRARWAK